jgi:predicted O-linked N-acetylglucosamine transferase (SPINDLY family)
MDIQLQLMLKQAIEAFQAQKFDNATLFLKKILQVDSKNLPALHILGLVKASQSNYKEAADYLTRAARIEPNDASIQYNLAKALTDSGNDKGALIHHEKAISLAPNNPEAWLSYGKTTSNLGRYDDALVCYGNALNLKPGYADALLNKGATLKELKRYDEAITFAEQALAINPNLTQAWSNKGGALKELKRYEEAIACYDKALSLQPDYHEALTNKGATLKELKRYDEAIACYDKALSLQPDYHEALTNKGATLKELERYDEAIACYGKALNLSPNIDWIYGDLVDVKLKICNWLDLTTLLEIISKKVIANEKTLQPFSLLTLTDDALLHKKSSEIATKSRYPFTSILGDIPKHPKREKIRVGYFSADLKNHPVAFLMAELFEIHDRGKFEIFAFSLVRACDSMSMRLKKAFDHFIDVDGMSDVAVAKLARDYSIDIAVDLSGFTKDARTGIFSYCAAPIQVNYLGYPGTMGTNYIDYIIADKTLIPLESQSYYSEKAVYLPNSYQVNDRNRLISDRKFTRQELGLPEEGFVFCCFNNNFKILPSTFDSWMRILKAVEGSVLWLLQDNPQAVENLKKEAHKKGIDMRRLVFADRAPLSEHLARHRSADLFIDTLPYNAHTTASDALWTGLPVLTLQGHSFTSRVASSLLNAIELPELITYTQEAYEALAIELAKNREKLASIKQKLENNRLTTPLFDTPLFTRNLEAAYIEMMERYWLDLKPDHIAII